MSNNKTMDYLAPETSILSVESCNVCQLAGSGNSLDKFPGTEWE